MDENRDEKKKILAIDSSGLVASAAVICGDELIAEYTVNYKKTHSQTLLPMLEEIKKMTDLDLDSIDAIAVAAGPGSFTGLRIGSATAKGLGLALNKPLIGVPTVDGLAYNLYGTENYICPIMDARRNQVYTGIYRVSGNRLECLLEQSAVDILEIVEKINEYSENVVFLGDGVPVHRAVLEERITVPYQFAPLHLNRQSAAAVAALGVVYMAEGRMEDAKDHKPVYLRKSQAERERAKRLQEQGA